MVGGDREDAMHGQVGSRVACARLWACSVKGRSVAVATEEVGQGKGN